MHSDTTATESGSLLVTGGTGFLGLHLCEHFRERGWDVTAFDLKPFEPGDNIDGVGYIEGDVRDEAAVAAAIDDTGADAVVHAAAALALWDDDTIREVTVEGTRNVLSAAVDHGVDRVVYLSSIVVYGDAADVDPPITEDAPLSAVGAYGASKIDAEAVCRSFRDELCVPILRPTSFIGPRRLGIFQVLFDWIEDGANVPLIGPGTNRYQLLHVSDLVAAIELLLETDETMANDTYNVGTDEFGTMREDFQAPIDRAGTGKRTVGTPIAPTVFALRVLERFDLSPLYPWIYETAHEDYYLSVEKLKGVGWEPAYSNREALVETFEWYLENYEDGPDAPANTDADGFDHRAGWDQGALTPVKYLFRSF